MRVLNNVLHNTLAQVSIRARFMSSTWSSTLCGCPFFDSLFLALFLSVCFSYLFFFYLNLELNEESGPLAENTPLTVRVVQGCMLKDGTNNKDAICADTIARVESMEYHVDKIKGYHVDISQFSVCVRFASVATGSGVMR